MAAECDLPQWHIVSSNGRRDLPRGVIAYTTRGGVSAYTVRSTIPVLCRSRSRWESVRFRPGTGPCAWSQRRHGRDSGFYEETVLRALEETENALANYHAQQALLIKLNDQARESKRAADIARLRYREGVVDFLSLLDAERTQLQAEDAVAESEKDVYVAVIALYKALGGVPSLTTKSGVARSEETGGANPFSSTNSLWLIRQRLRYPNHTPETPA